MCVRSFIVTTVYTRPSKRATKMLCNVHAARARKKGCTVSQQPFRMQHTAHCCYTCSLIRFLLLGTLASPALGVLLNHFLRSHARWAYGDPVACCEPFLHGLHPHALTLVLLLLDSWHMLPFIVPPSPHPHAGRFWCERPESNRDALGRGILSPLCLPISPRSQRWPAQRDSNSRPCA